MADLFADAHERDGRLYVPGRGRNVTDLAIGPDDVELIAGSARAILPWPRRWSFQQWGTSRSGTFGLALAVPTGDDDIERVLDREYFVAPWPFDALLPL